MAAFLFYVPIVLAVFTIGAFLDEFFCDWGLLS